MAGALRQGDSCRADEPESSKDLSSPPADDHDGEWCNHPHIRPALFRLDGGPLAGSCKLKLLFILATACSPPDFILVLARQTRADTRQQGHPCYKAAAPLLGSDLQLEEVEGLACDHLSDQR